MSDRGAGPVRAPFFERETACSNHSRRGGPAMFSRRTGGGSRGRDPAVGRADAHRRRAGTVGLESGQGRPDAGDEPEHPAAGDEGVRHPRPSGALTRASGALTGSRRRSPHPAGSRSRTRCRTLPPLREGSSQECFPVISFPWVAGRSRGMKPNPGATAGSSRGCHFERSEKSLGCRGIPPLRSG